MGHSTTEHAQATPARPRPRTDRLFWRWPRAFYDALRSRRARRLAEMTLRQARRLVIAVIGGTVLLIGIVMIIPPIPGPGIVVIPAGLAILAIEFVWARRLLRRFKETGDAARRRLGRWWRRKPAEDTVAATPSPTASEPDRPRP